MLRLLLITVRSDFGGGPRHVDQLIGELPDDIDLFLAYPQIGKPYADKWKCNRRIKGTLYIPYRKFSFLTLLQLKKFVEKNEIDIIHSHGNGAGLYSRLLKQIGVKAKVVHTFHGISDEYSSKIKYILSLATGCLLAPFADVYVAVSDGEKLLGIKRGFCKEKKCEVVYNGIVDEKLQAVGLGSRIVVTLSRYNFQKNMSLCLDIARQMKTDDVKFVWVGDGEDYKVIKDAVDKECLPVEMVGFQSQPMNFLVNASVYLSTSRFEGLPYALIEAASVGLPIVATDVKGNNEVAINDDNGITFKTAEEGVSALRTLLNDEHLYMCMSSNSRRLFEEKFTLEVMIEHLKNIYSSLISKT